MKWALCIFCALLLLPSCRSVITPPAHTVQMRPSPLRTSAAYTSNVYRIQGYANTNHETVISNSWPKRVHINLSLDGGVTFPRRIAYGLPTDNNRHEIVYDYALPWWDTSLLTTAAVVQVTDLAGVELCQSDSYYICGLFVTAPAAGSTLVNGTLTDVEWMQYGGTPVVNLGYITQGGEFTVIQAISNAVDGANSYTWTVALPVTNAIKLAVQSASDPYVWGITGILTAQ